MTLAAPSRPGADRVLATGDPPVELEALKVAAGTATLTIPPGMKSGTLIVRDAVSGTSVTITVVEKL